MANQDTWYHSMNGVDKKGPFTWDQLLAANMRGEIPPGTLVWGPHLPGWISLEEAQKGIPKEFCRFCGGQVPSGSPTCPGCGKELRSGQVIDKQAIAEKVKEAALDAKASLQSLALNPIGKLKPSHDALPPNRILAAGVVFGIIFSILLAISISMWNKNLGNLVYDLSYIQILIAGFVPFIGCTLSLTLIRMISKAKGEFASDCYISGTTLLPFGIAAFVSALLGQANVEIILILMVTSFCYTVLILFTGLVEIFNMSKGISSLLISFILIASAWIDKVILTSMA